MLGTTRARATQTEHVIAEVCNVGVQTKDEKVVPVNNSDTPFAPLSFGERVILMLVLAFFSVCFMCLLHVVFGRDDIQCLQMTRWFAGRSSLMIIDLIFFPCFPRT